MNIQKELMQKEKKYIHLAEKDLTDGKEISEIIASLSPLSRILVAVYARGLSDMQEANKKITN